MNRFFDFKAAFIFISMTVISLWGQELLPVKLPAPTTTGGKPLMQALAERKSLREFSSKELPEQLISNLLWAACGVNRKETGKRTAPSAGNAQEIDIYVATTKGVYLYNAKEHILRPVLPGDLRNFTGRQNLVQKAPLVLVYVSDHSRLRGEKDFYSATDTGFISQNVYLFCASEGLATVVLGMVDRNTLSQKLGLKPEQKVILTQPVGYPAN